MTPELEPGRRIATLEAERGALQDEVAKLRQTIKTIIKTMSEAHHAAFEAEKARADQLKAQLAEKEKLIRLACVDAADDDTRIRELCKPHLTEFELNGDPNGVPGIIEVVEITLSKLKAQLAQAQAALKIHDGATKEDSLTAAIEGDYSKMAHSDLVLTAQMLERGRVIWRKEAESAKAEIEQLNKALALKLDAMPSGLSAGQSMKLEKELSTTKEQLAQAQEQYKVLREATVGAGWLSPDEAKALEAKVWEQAESVKSDTEIDHAHIIEFWENHTAPGNPHHSIFEWLEWLVARADEAAKLQAQLKALNEALHSSTGLQLLDDRLCFDGEAFKQLQAQCAAMREAAGVDTEWPIWDLIDQLLLVVVDKDCDWAVQSIKNQLNKLKAIGDSTAGQDLLDRLHKAEAELAQLKSGEFGPRTAPHGRRGER